MAYFRLQLQIIQVILFFFQVILHQLDILLKMNVAIN